MKRISIIALFGLLLTACQSEPTLQKYFVENTEKKDFISLDVSPNILNLDKAKLTAEQKTALESFDKMNILAFKVDSSNVEKYDAEREKINKILKDEKYQQLMKFGSGKDGASISYVGDDEHIDEFVLYANRKENGFAVVRILGKDMNPTNIVTMVSALQNANINMEQLKPLQEMLEKK